MSRPSTSKASGEQGQTTKKASGTSRPSAKKSGLREFLAKGFNAMFTMCRENSIRTAELERRTVELDENF
jgi:hypothetical protein